MSYQYPAYSTGRPAEAPREPVDPIIARLRPRDVAGILDQSFRLYRKHFLTFLAITAVVFVPVQLIVQVLSVLLQGDQSAYTESVLRSSSSSSFDSSTFGEFYTTFLIASGVVIVIALVGTFIEQLAHGALTSAVAESYLEKPVGFASAWGEALKRIGPLLGAVGLQLLILLALASPIILLFLLGFGVFFSDLGNLESGTSSGAASGALGLICGAYCLLIPAFILGAYIFVRLSLVAPAIMIENLGPRQALRRSWRLVEGYWWRTFGILLIVGILAAIVEAGPAALITATGIALTGDLSNIWVNIFAAVVTVATGAIFIPIQLTATTLYYFDLRVRKEGYDIETAMAQAYGGWGQAAPYGPGYGYGQPGQPQYPYPGQYQQPQPNATLPPPALGYGEQQSYGYQQQYPYNYEQQTQPETPRAPQETIDLNITPAPAETAPEESPYTAPDWLARVSAQYSQEPPPTPETTEPTEPPEAPESTALGKDEEERES
jgi:hypothetical protein